MAEKHFVLSLLVQDGAACAVELERWLYERSGLLGATTELVDRALVLLCAEGLVAATGVLRRDETGPRSRRRVFAATPAGTEELWRWSREPAPCIEPDRPLLPSSPLGRAAAEALLAEARRHERRCRSDLAVHRHTAHDEGRRSQTTREIGRELVYNLEIARLESELRLMTGLQALMLDFLGELRAG